ncbi:serine hydrolase [Isosphaeraceae bacterium EP7]
MKTSLFSALVACSVALGLGAGPPSAGLPRSSPEAQGLSSLGILAFVDAVDKSVDSLHGLIIVRHGQVVSEGWWAPYDSTTPHSLFSLSKSFTSTAVGLAIADGKLSVDDQVLKFFPEDAPTDPSKNLQAMRVSDLLRMSTGQQEEPPRKPDQSWTKAFLAQPVPFKPGTHFLYNTSATYMLSAIVQKVTGMTVLDYLKPRIFEPLGIENPTWGTSPQGITLGGYGLSVRTEDIAKFGQLFLQKGVWQGKQLVPESWVDAATAMQTSNGSNPKSDWDQGYGYQFWRSRNNAYRGDGAFGQYCVVLPEQDAVIAINAGLKDMQSVLDLVWEHLLPAMKPSALPANDALVGKLKARLEGLSMRPQDGSKSPGKLSGKTYTFPENERKIESIKLVDDGKGDGATLVIRTDGEERTIACGRGSWTRGRTAFMAPHEQACAASGAWTADDTYKAKICLYETPFVVTTTLKFNGDELTLDLDSNVGFGQTTQKQLVGKAK